MAFPFALILPSNIVISMQIEVETVDRTGTFLGSLWESRTNMAIALVEAGLAKFTSFAGSDRIPDAHLLEQAEKSAKNQKLKVCGAANFIFFIVGTDLLITAVFLLIMLIYILLQIWENYVEGEEVSNGLLAEKQKEVLNVWDCSE